MQTPEQNRTRSNEYNRRHREERRAYARGHYQELKKNPGFKMVMHEKYLKWKGAHPEDYRKQIIRNRPTTRKWFQEQMHDPEKHEKYLETRRGYYRKRRKKVFAR